MLALEVKGLNKTYKRFALKDISFQLEQGYIMGFIGSNGAGKTTTLKSILNMIQVESGEVAILGQNFIENEISLKQKIGQAFGGVDFYTKNKIKTVTAVIKRFYTNWDDELYRNYLKRFKLDEDKKLSELSEGMKVKYALTLALSYQAKLLILDEPTSGLDPVARDNLLELFQELVEDGEKSILFSTHITSDLEKCADYITYIVNGRIVGSGTKDDFINTYKIIKGNIQKLDEINYEMIAYKTNAFGFSGLVNVKNYQPILGITAEEPTLEEIMIFHSKKEDEDEESII